MMEKHLETLQGLHAINCFWFSNENDDPKVKALYLFRQALGQQRQDIEMEALNFTEYEWHFFDYTLKLILDK